MMSRRGAAGFFFAVLAFAAAVLFMIVRFALPPPIPVAVPIPAPLGPPLTHRLLFVVVDGLRYDVATDPTLMPAFAQRMAERRSAEIWAGVVSMTSAAILTYGTGQHGEVEQIIKNHSGTPVSHDDFISHARDAGLVTACVGDRTWFKLYPNRWTLSHPDPYGVAIDVDYNAEIFAAARTFLTGEPRPNLFVLHFVTPDHQGHAYGIFSDRYKAHIRGFDRDFAALLAEVPPEWTVIVTSDHGATPSGTHGTDTAIQRRSPIYAFGPGIAKKSGDGGVLHQIDLAGTLAALIGVPAPAHGRGHLLVDWLDVDDGQRAKMACADLVRLSAFARATLTEPLDPTIVESACAVKDPHRRITAAAAAAHTLDQAISDAHITGRFALLAPLFVVIAALALGRVAFRGGVRFGKATALGLGLIAFSVTVIYAIERLPWRWPDIVRAFGYITLNAALLVGVVRRRASAEFFDKYPFIGAALLPGLVVVSETKTTQPEAFVLATVFSFLALVVGLPRTLEAPIISFQRSSWPRIALVALLFVGLLPLAFREAGYLPRAVETSPDATFALAMVSIGLFVLFVSLRRRPEVNAPPNLFVVAALGALACLCLFLRRVAPAPLCLVGWFGSAIVLVFLAFIAPGRRVRAYIELVALTSYAWVSRDAELPLLLATYAIAVEVGESLRVEGNGRITPSLVLGIVTFLFSWTYVQRVGVELGLDFGHFDFGAGSFRQQGTSLVRIAAALVYKHGLARVGVIAAVLVPLSPRLRVFAAQGLFLAELGRTTMLIVLFYACRDSFWTSLRVVADAPHSLTATVVAAGAYGVSVMVVRKEEFRDNVMPRQTV